MLWCAGVVASGQLSLAGEEGQLCGQDETGQPGVSGREEDEGQDQSHPGKALSPLYDELWQMGSSFSHWIIPPIPPKRSAGAHLYLLPSDCTTAVETTVYNSTHTDPFLHSAWYTQDTYLTSLSLLSLCWTVELIIYYATFADIFIIYYTIPYFI